MPARPAHVPPLCTSSCSSSVPGKTAFPPVTHFYLFLVYSYPFPSPKFIEMSHGTHIIGRLKKIKRMTNKPISNKLLICASSSFLRYRAL